MPEPISVATATTIISTGMKVSAITALIALFSTDINILMVVIVGVIGGFTYIGKEFVLEEFMENPLKNILNMPFSILMAISLTGIVFYAGKDGFNPHVKDLGTYIWIFLAFMASMNYRRVVDTLFSSILTPLLKSIVKVIDILAEKWSKK